MEIDRHIEKYIRYLEIEKNASEHTILNYKKDLEEFKKFLGEAKIESVSYLTLRKFLSALKERGLKSRSISRKLSSLRSFFRFFRSFPTFSKSWANEPIMEKWKININKVIFLLISFVIYFVYRMALLQLIPYLV